GHERLVGVAGAIRDEGQRLVAPHEEAPAVRFLGGQDILEEQPPVFGQVRGLRLRFELDGLEHEVRGVDLAVRMRVAHADDVALVLEHQHVPYRFARAEFAERYGTCWRSEEHTSELPSRADLVCRPPLEKQNTRSATKLSV